MTKRKFLYRSIFLFFSTAGLIWSIIDYNDYITAREEESIHTGQKVVDQISADVNDILISIMDKGNTMADSLTNRDYSRGQLLDLIKKESNSLSQILGITVAFEPFIFEKQVRLFAPYYDKSQEKFIYIENVYDYTDKNLPTAQWYVSVKEHGENWVEPYYAKGAKAMVTDYGIPFYREINGKRQIAGTVTMTVSLKDFSKLLNRLSLGKTGYGFIISPNGNYIAHPVQEYVGQKSILEVASEKQDEVLNEVGKWMMDQQSGYELFNSQYTNQLSYLFYKDIPPTQWSLGLVFIQNELLGSPVNKSRKLMHIGFLFSLFTFSLFLMIYRFKLTQEKYLWKGVILFSILMVLNIAFIWYLTQQFSTLTSDSARIKISNASTLNRFLNLEREQINQLRLDSLIEIPTGVYIHQVEFEDSYSVSISATIWQKYDHRKTKGIPREIELPQTSPFAESLMISKKTTSYEQYEIVTWNVRGTFRFNFDYNTYPFDYRKLDFKITHPHKAKNIILTPFLESYKIISQSALPGVNKDVVLPESSLDVSFYDYSKTTYNADFGVESFDRQAIPEIHFNVVLKRKFINPFVSNFVPILIVTIMVYFILYSSGKHAAKTSSISSLGVVESSAAFFFVLILAHIDLRKSVNTPVLTYMEMFYFIMYIILGLVSFNIVMFTKNKNYLFFDYKDNLITKVLYWPVFLGLCLAVTILEFY